MPSLRRLAELALANGGPARLARHLHHGRTLILAYHNIVASDADAGADRSLHLLRTTFERQIRDLRCTHDFIPLADSLGRPPRRARPRVAVTFDDAYLGAMTHGIDVLVEANVPATVFVAPGRLGGTSFWWDVVASGDPAVLARFRHHVLEVLGGQDALARAAAPDFGLRISEVPHEARTATETELRLALSRHSALTLGAHSWTHPNLARVDSTALHEELAQPLAWLRPFGERALAWLAFPYGCTSPAVQVAARDAGYVAGLRVEGGWLPAGAKQLLGLPRVNVPAGLTDAGFTLRTAGVLR